MPLPIKTQAQKGAFRTIGEEDVMCNLKEYQKAIAFYRWYPDKFVDFLCQVSGPDCTFKLYPYQRLILRAMARYPDVNLTFSRGTSKSFTNILWQIIMCILYPNSKVAVAASTKGQSAQIVGQKASEVFALIPALKFELKGEIKKVKDDLTITFKNGSWIMNVAAKGSTRGQRAAQLVVEEIIEADPDAIESVVRPLLAINRMAGNGQRDPNERIKRQEVIITTAGVKDTYAYSRLIRNLIRMVTEPGKAIVLGGSYRIPIIAGLQDMDWIREMKMSGTFNPTSFPREFLSHWSSGSDSAYYPADSFDKNRSLTEPEFERTGADSKMIDYFFGIDCGRHSDASEIVIIKKIRVVGSISTKHVVNIVTLEDMPFPEQAVHIKELFNQYQPKGVAIDATGIGTNLVDELVTSQVSPTTGAFLRPWGVINDPEGRYGRFKTADTITNVLYIIKATASFNTVMYSNLQTQLLTGKLRFLVDEASAKLKVEASRAKKFKEMTDDDILDYLKPFYQTSFLKTQMINLESSNEGVNIIMKRSNSSIRKDKVSALGYLLHYLKLEYDDKELACQVMTLDQMLKINGQASRALGQQRAPKASFNNSKRDYFTQYSKRKKK